MNQNEMFDIVKTKHFNLFPSKVLSKWTFLQNILILIKLPLFWGGRGGGRVLKKHAILPSHRNPAQPKETLNETYFGFFYPPGAPSLYSPEWLSQLILEVFQM